MTLQRTLVGKGVLLAGLAGSAVCAGWLLFGEPKLSSLLGPPPPKGAPSKVTIDLTEPVLNSEFFAQPDALTKAPLGQVMGPPIPEQSTPAPAPRSKKHPKPDVEQPHTVSLEEMLSQVGLGEVNWERPTELRPGQSAPVTVSVKPAPEPARPDYKELWKHLTAHDEEAPPSSDGPALKIEPTHVQLMLRATLYGEGFKVEPEAAQLLMQRDDAIPAWTWEVTALKSGTRELYLRLESLVQVKGETVPRRADTLHIPVKVEPSLSDFAQANWQWFAGAVVLPLAGFFGSRLFRRNDREVAYVDRRWSSRSGGLW